MTIEQKIKKPYMIKLAVWIAASVVFGLVCFLYHSRPESKFPITGSAVISLLVLALIFYYLDLRKYFFDKQFSGEIIEMNVRSDSYMPTMFIPHIYVRTFVLMTVKCDNGYTVTYDQVLPEQLSRKVPFRVGDRVYHIKGSHHTCRFPRNDTEKVYEPISVICPVCGAINTLGTKECAFCNTELPHDPAVR